MLTRIKLIKADKQDIVKKRKIGLSIIIILLVLSNLAGVFKLQSNPEEFVKVYTFLSANQVIWIAVIPIATIISLVAMWFGKRWGIVLVIFSFMVVLFLDVYYTVWSHALLAAIGFVLLLFFTWQSRQYFRDESGE